MHRHCLDGGLHVKRTSLERLPMLEAIHEQTQATGLQHLVLSPKLDMPDIRRLVEAL
ncbi:MAG: hypothetical protein IPK21_06715 [Haliscomenobacter sp.]|nr:hypothetical protein [Haliscomenobacter sp.]